LGAVAIFNASGTFHHNRDRHFAAAADVRHNGAAGLAVEDQEPCDHRLREEVEIVEIGDAIERWVAVAGRVQSHQHFFKQDLCVQRIDIAITIRVRYSRPDER
jgi:hypothetical protein